MLCKLRIFFLIYDGLPCHMIYKLYRLTPSVWFKKISLWITSRMPGTLINGLINVIKEFLLYQGSLFPSLCVRNWAQKDMLLQGRERKFKRLITQTSESKRACLPACLLSFLPPSISPSLPPLTSLAPTFAFSFNFIL